MSLTLSPLSRQLSAMLGVDVPLIQAPMAGVQGSELALAVSAAGALGSLPAAMLTPEQLRAELGTLAQATARPVNINFFCHTPPPPDAAREARWLARLAPYYAELGATPAPPAGPGRQPFDAAALALLLEFRPRVVSFHFGLPAAALLAPLKAAGAVILASATTVAEALWLEAHGADVVIAQGLEAGGHRGMFLSSDVGLQVGTFALLPQIVQAVRCPVVAAGGIADADGIAAAMRLGAAGVQLGTTYLLCPEARTTAIHRAALQSEGARETALTNLFSGRPARGIVNRLMREIGPCSPDAPAFPLATAAVAPLRAAAEAVGSGDFSPLWAGQNVSGCRPIGAAELTRELAAGLHVA